MRITGRTSARRPSRPCRPTLCHHDGMSTEVRCPMIECRRRIDLEMLPPFPRTPDPLPCLHFIAAWGPARAKMAEAVLFALEGNRELLLRNIRPAEVRQDYIDESRADLEAVARR